MFILINIKIHTSQSDLGPEYRPCLVSGVDKGDQKYFMKFYKKHLEIGQSDEIIRLCGIEISHRFEIQSSDAFWVAKNKIVLISKPSMHISYQGTTTAQGSVVTNSMPAICL